MLLSLAVVTYLHVYRGFAVCPCCQLNSPLTFPHQFFPLPLLQFWLVQLSRTLLKVSVYILPWQLSVCLPPCSTCWSGLVQCKWCNLYRMFHKLTAFTCVDCFSHVPYEMWHICFAVILLSVITQVSRSFIMSILLSISVLGNSC